MLSKAYLSLALAAAHLAAAVPIEPRWKQALLGLENGKKKLTFDANGNFKVVSFSDMHFGERWGNGSWADWGPQADANTQRVHGTILDYEKPNYVVFNGDIMTGENVFADNATGYQDQCYAPTVARGLPFSSTHGNHDNANNINHQEEIEYEMAHYANLSYTRSDAGPKPYGSGNYWVPVYAKESDYAPALIMWFFDSRSFVSGTGDGPGPVPDAANYYWVDENTVPPYIHAQATMMEAEWGKIPPALAFVHIPLQKSDILANSTLLIGDQDDDPDPAAQGYNSNNTYTGLDLPFFNALVSLNQNRGNVLAVTSGHDHGDSWCGKSANSSYIALCFDGHSGYGGYTTPNSVVRNGRVFNLNLKNLSASHPTVETWNSYENRTINDQITLGPDFLT